MFLTKKNIVVYIIYIFKEMKQKRLGMVVDYWCKFSFKHIKARKLIHAGTLKNPNFF